MKKLFPILILFFNIYSSFGQELIVEVKGVGLNRSEALNDARRMAVGKAMGVSVKSETEVKNMVTIYDAISTQTSGWVTGEKIIKETPLSNSYEIELEATVSQKVLDEDVKSLAQWLGGMQFLVFYDPRELPKKDIALYQYAYDRFNEKLKSRQYRYVERMNFENLSTTEEVKSLKEEVSEFSYVQKLGATVKSEFILFIDKIEIRNYAREGFAPGYKVTINTRAYDNCTAEGFAPKVMEGSSSIPDSATGVRSAIDEAINKYSESLFYEFNKYMGDWVSNGAVFEIRFYNYAYEDLIPLKGKIKSDQSFGQQLSVNMETNYIKWNLTFNKTPDEMIDFFLINFPQLRVSNIYGRLITFKPRTVTPNTNSGNK